jgi:hypothetical protein
MRAQQMPKQADHPWSAGVNMPVLVGVFRAAVASLLVAHDAQDARKIRLQHIDNNHPGAPAKRSQTLCLGTGAPGRTGVPPRRRPSRSGELRTSTAGWPPEAPSTVKQLRPLAVPRQVLASMGRSAVRADNPTR